MRTVFLFLAVSLLPLSHLQAQELPEDLILNQYQPEGKASRTITLKNGFSVPGVSQFIGEIVPNFPATPPVIVQSPGCGYVLLQPQTPAPEKVTYYFLRSLTDADLKFTSPGSLKVGEAGTYYLRAYSSTGYWSLSSTSITVTADAFPPPASHPAKAYVFYLSDGSAELRTQQAAPAGMVYYWQTSATGTATNKPAVDAGGKYFKATTGGTYYLRTKVANTDCWSEGVTPVQVQMADKLSLQDDLKILPEPTGVNENYVVENTLLVEKDAIPALGLYVAEMSQQISYFDGLGRPLQTVQTQGNPSKKDIVQPVAYDPFGRQNKQYLPYPHVSSRDGHYQPNAIAEQQQQLDVLKNNPGPAYTESRLEASPLNRVLEQGAPGTNWQIQTDPAAGHTVKTSNRTNTENEVREWKYTFDDPATATNEARIDGSTYYASTCAGDPQVCEGQLFVTETTDENGYKSLTYTDKEGRVICKKVQETADGNAYLTTYYVYDSFGYLRFVIPPKALDQLAAKNYTVSVANDAAFIGDWLFSYTYDLKGRVIEKQVPGTAPVYQVYNKRDELILSQDGKQRNGYNGKAAGEWSFTKYDAFGRIVLTGLYAGGTKTRKDLQDAADAATATYEEAGTAIHGYTNTALPTIADADVLLVNYYDTYSFPEAASYAYTRPAVAGRTLDGFAVSPSSKIRGKLTASKVKVLATAFQTGNNVRKDWLYTVSYYDQYGRVIQVQADNHLSGKVITSSRLDFIGRVVETHTRHENLPQASRRTLVVRNRNVFDHAARPRATYQTIYEKPDDATTAQPDEEPIAEQNYNELGEVIQKKLGRDLQTIDYTYNIRGWLSGINNAALTQTSGQPKDLFGMELRYQEGDFQGQNQQHNGNITGQRWKTAINGVERTYNYAYDPLNRLTAAAYTFNNDGASIPAPASESFAVSNISYDRNGNILSMHRMGMTAGLPDKPTAFNFIDKLTYSYALTKTVSGQAVVEERGNQLRKVSDGIAATVGTGDFKDGVNMGEEYLYDADGNLVADKNKGITSVVYNHLNLPTEIVFTPLAGTVRKLTFVYDASGRKVQKQVLGAEVTDYISGMVYTDGVLEFIPTGEGRALSPEKYGVPTFAYEYSYKDHLGNLRLSFRENYSAQYWAGMETVNAVTEELQFDNVNTSRSGTWARTGGKSAKVNQGQPLGPWKTIKVRKGDKISAQAYAFYEKAGSNGARVNWGVVLGPQDTQGATPNAEKQSNNIWNKLRVGITLNPTQINTSSAAPIAYLKCLFFDTQYNPVADQTKLSQVSPAAQEGWEPVRVELIAQQEGYVQVLVANESEKPVWFDDIQITHQPQLIVQENHYDPWGLNLVGIEKQGTPDNKFEFLGQEKQHEFELNWTLTPFRILDSQLGRFHQIDLLTDLIPGISGYQYAYNNPSTLADPTGLLPEMNEDFADGSGRDRGKKKKGQYDNTEEGTKPKKKPSAGSGSTASTPANNGVSSFEYWLHDNVPGFFTNFHPVLSAYNSARKYKTGKGVDGKEADTWDYALGWLDFIPELGPEVKIGVKYALPGAGAAIMSFFLKHGDEAGDVAKGVSSIVKKDSKLLKLAQETFEGNNLLTKEANGLIEQLNKGNMNPGIGTKNIGKNIFEARSKGGARVYFRNGQNGVEIVGYSNKANQQQVINRILEIY
jgi:RHS repeat-associated protein